MKPLRKFLDKIAPSFENGGKLSRFYPLYEAADTILFTPGKVTTGSVHIRDGIDQKRMMIFVVFALVPCILFALFNTGYQANLVLSTMSDFSNQQNWRLDVLSLLGIPLQPTLFASVIHGALYFVPVLLVILTVGGIWEVLFAIIRRHEVTEGFLVTAFLTALIVPANIPFWQLAIAVTFGIVVGKEVFGGVGFNFLNPALLIRSFLFFAYPAQISGDMVWVAVDGYSKATPLSVAFQGGLEQLTQDYSWWDAFIGLIPGSMGETSALACLLGAGFLLTTGIGSWRTMLSVLIGMVVTILGFNALAPLVENPMFNVPPHWHFVMGGYAFGLVFMATDPVSSAVTNTGKLVYGFLIGVLVSVIRVLNPAYPEGMMLAILFMNVFAPLIDYFVVQKNIKRRKVRYGS